MRWTGSGVDQGGGDCRGGRMWFGRAAGSIGRQRGGSLTAMDGGCGLVGWERRINPVGMPVVVNFGTILCSL